MNDEIDLMVRIFLPGPCRKDIARPARYGGTIMLWSPLLLMIGIQTGAEMPSPIAMRSVRITDVSDRPVESGIVKSYFAVEGTMPDGEKRIFYILYFGRHQSLPAMTNLCTFYDPLPFRQMAQTDKYAVPAPMVRSFTTERFACVDSPHDPIDETPSRKLEGIVW